MENKLVPYNEVSRIAGTRVVVLAPHPDDEVFGCGGAIMRHVAAGDLVQIFIASDGESRVDASEQVKYGESRQAESRKAALIMGCGTPLFWGIPDRGVEYGERLVRRIEGAIEALDADLVYAPSIYEMHPDHRALGMAAMEAVRRHAAQPQLAMYEVGVPMTRPNVLLDISDLAQRKQRAMECFASQLGEQAYDQHISALNRFRTYTLGKHVTAAEAYFVIAVSEAKSDLGGLYASEYETQRSIGLPMVPSDLPLVSVLVLSEERSTLSFALDSIALQTYSNIEVIVVNVKGRGLPVEGDLCGRFPMRIVSNCATLGRSQAANLALDSARGKYLIILDDNVRFEPHQVAVLVALMQRKPQNKAVFSATQDSDTGTVRRPVTGDSGADAVWLMTNILVPLHAMLFDICLVQAGCRFDETLHLYEDWDFQLQVAQHTGFSRTDRVGGSFLAAENGRGVGHGIVEVKNPGREHIYAKWKAIWTGEKVSALLSHTESAMDALEQSLRAQNETLNSVIKKFEMELEFEQKRFLGLVSSNESLQRGLAESESSSARLIAEIHSSSSWRITAPLRWAGEKVRKVKQAFCRAP